MWLRSGASVLLVGSLLVRFPWSAVPQTAPELVGTLNVSRHHQCANVCISLFGQKLLINALKCKCDDHDKDEEDDDDDNEDLSD